MWVFFLDKKMSFNQKLSIRYKIFIALLVLNLLFLTIMAAINFYQSSKTILETQLNNVRAREATISENFAYETYSLSLKDSALTSHLKEKVFKIANIYNVPIQVYSLKGEWLISSIGKQTPPIAPNLLNKILKSDDNKAIEERKSSVENQKIYQVYETLSIEGKPAYIVSTEHIVDNNLTQNQFKILIKQYILIIIMLMILSVLIAWAISKSITKEINNLAKKFERTNVESLNQPISYKNTDEIKPLVISYNQMLRKLKKQTETLAKTEREEAWKDMARQVAHEINNPLTPLRLTVQNFQNRFDKNDPNIDEKVKTISKSIIHQIDLVSDITKAFSDFAKMPSHKNDWIDVVETLKHTLEIFPKDITYFESNVEGLIFKMDRLYLTRVITNVVKNGLQALKEGSESLIFVKLQDAENHFLISVSDNGTGIPKEYHDRVFESKFTTKSTGMGLGLPMVKKIIEDYHGRIWFESEENKGTTFYIEFKKE